LTDRVETLTLGHLMQRAREHGSGLFFFAILGARVFAR
jgi:hypothetical protein